MEHRIESDSSLLDPDFLRAALRAALILTKELRLDNCPGKSLMYKSVCRYLAVELC